MKKTICIILTAIAIICLFGAGILVLQECKQHRDAREIWEKLRPAGDFSAEESTSTAEESSAAAEGSTSTTEESSAAAEESASTAEESSATSETDTSDTIQETKSEDKLQETTPQNNLVANPYADSFLANEDMAAWLTVPDTEIDYPVMWTPRDENYYLYKDFEGKENKNGCLILDTDSCLDPLTTNLIIHGHNMKSGAMFGNLTDYTSKDYYENHKQIILHTKTEQRNYEVIAVFRSQVYKKTDQVFKFYKFFQADTEEEFNDFYNNIKKLSLYDTGVSAQFGDHFITLSTCVYHVTNGRFVVVAKEIDSTNSYLPIE